jgi:DNA repair protein RadC
MPEDDRAAEHRWHWLLDTLHPGPRLRGETLGIDEPEVRAVLDSARASLRAGLVRLPQVVRAIVATFEALLAERRQRARSRSRRRLTARAVETEARTSAGSVELPRDRARLLPGATPPWLLDPMPRPSPSRPGRVWEPARPRRVAPTPACRVRLLRPLLLCTRFDPTETARVTAPLELEPERIADLEIALRLAPGVRADDRIEVASSAHMAALFAQALGDAMGRERILVAPLDTRNRLIGVHAVAVGGAARCAVSLADVFRAVLLASSSRYFVAHNHPSGALSPSDDDLVLTRRLYTTGRDLGLELCDHLILGFHGAFHSLRAHGEGVDAWTRSRERGPRPNLRLVVSRPRRPADPPEAC